MPLKLSLSFVKCAPLCAKPSSPPPPLIILLRSSKPVAFLPLTVGCCLLVMTSLSSNRKSVQFRFPLLLGGPAGERGRPDGDRLRLEKDGFEADRCRLGLPCGRSDTRSSTSMQSIKSRLFDMRLA